MSEIRPALTAEEWEAWERARQAKAARFPDATVPLLSMNDPHSMAAILLHGQPFGFTWEDVDRLYDVAGADMALLGYHATAAELRLLADRIAALLPPRDSA